MVMESPTPLAATETKSTARHIITVAIETNYNEDKQRGCKNSLAEKPTATQDHR